MDAKQLLSIARDQYLHDCAAVEVDGSVKTYFPGFDLSEFARRLLEADLYAPPSKEDPEWIEFTDKAKAWDAVAEKNAEIARLEAELGKTAAERNLLSDAWSAADWQLTAARRRNERLHVVLEQIAAGGAPNHPSTYPSELECAADTIRNFMEMARRAMTGTPLESHESK